VKLAIVGQQQENAARGYSGASHGCVNVRNLTDIQALFAQAQVGDKVIVHRCLASQHTLDSEEGAECRRANPP